MNKDKKQEFTLKISNANKTEMVVILYDMTIEYLQDALEEFDANNVETFKWNIEKAKDCLDELLNSLHMEYEPAGVLKSLYFFYKREITTAEVRQIKEKIFPVIKMLQELKESYEKIASQDTSSPIMENTQTVYAGLTYGKNSLNIDLSDQSIDRGFRV